MAEARTQVYNVKLQKGDGVGMVGVICMVASPYFLYGIYKEYLKAKKV